MTGLTTDTRWKATSYFQGLAFPSRQGNYDPMSGLLCVRVEILARRQHDVGAKMVLVVAHFVDGDTQELTLDEDLLAQLTGLEMQGFEGKRLVNKLVACERDSVLSFVEVTATTVRGEALHLRLTYT